MPRIAIAQFWHETGTFNPEPTSRSQFETHRLELTPTTDPLVEPGSELDGALAVLAGRAGYELVTLFQAWGGVGGRVEDEFIEEIQGLLVDGLREFGPFDGCLLLLHGACASASEDDVDGLLVHWARQCLPSAPIAVTLDHHANLTRRLMEAATVVVGHRTEPHNPYETAGIAAQLLVQILDDSLDARMSWTKIPMIAPQERFETVEGPMSEVFQLARTLESGPVLCVSPFPMQPWLDVAEGGWAVAVVTDGDDDAGAAAVERVAGAMWDRRYAFWELTSVSEDEAIARADSFDGLGVICDMGDAVFGGGAGDSPRLIVGLISRDVSSGATVRDERAVDAAWLAGVGASVSVSLGGMVHRPHAGLLHVDATVEALGEGPIAVPGFFGLREIDEGRTALLRIGRVYVHVTERTGLGGCHPAAFQRYGMDVGALSVVVMKGSAHYHTYAPWMAGHVRANTPGLTQSNLRQFDWNRLPRPIFGLDDVAVEWSRAPNG